MPKDLEDQLESLMGISDRNRMIHARYIEGKVNRRACLVPLACLISGLTLFTDPRPTCPKCLKKLASIRNSADIAKRALGSLVRMIGDKR